MYSEKTFFYIDYILFIAFCIELIPQGNDGDGILILKNGVVESSIRPKPHFASTQTTCWNDFDFQNDIVELRHIGGNDGVSFHVNLIKEGVAKKMLFGSNADIDWIVLDSDLNGGNYGDDGFYCLALKEAAYAIKIKNGNLIESECVKPVFISKCYQKLLQNPLKSLKAKVVFDFLFD